MYQLALPFLYETPFVLGSTRTKALSKTLSERAEHRHHVRRLRVSGIGDNYSEDDYHEHDWPFFTPLPHCASIVVYRSKLEDDLNVPINVYTSWAASIGSVVTLEIHAAFRMPVDIEYDLDTHWARNWGSLTTLHVLNFHINHRELPMFWLICRPWLQSLTLEPQSTAMLNGSHQTFFLPAVTRFTILGPHASDLYWGGLVNITFPHLVSFTTSVAPRGADGGYSAQYTDVQDFSPTFHQGTATEAMEDLCLASEKGNFPALQVLSLGAPAASQSLLEFLGLVRGTGLVKLCEVKQISVQIRLGEVTHNFQDLGQ
jgi:hypothetical protein